MKKEELIEAFLAEPLKVGDRVIVRGLGIQNKEQFGSSSTEVKEINDDLSIVIDHNRSVITVQKEDYKKCVRHIGAYPFQEKPWDSEIRTITFSLESVLCAIGFDYRKGVFGKESIRGVEFDELNWNPFFLDKSGNEVPYQRDFVWGLKDNQLLIESIYQGIDIGKIVIRKRSFKFVEDRIKDSKVPFFKEIVDGKQRLNAIVKFIAGEYPDLYDNYWDDLSLNAKNKFLNYLAFSYAEIGETATDDDVKKIFLNINFSGKQMTQDHIDYVKSINL